LSYDYSQIVGTKVATDEVLKRKEQIIVAQEQHTRYQTMNRNGRLTFCIMITAI
jgi:hypothetical protein